MDNKVRRVFVEKKKGYDVEAKEMLNDLKSNLCIKGIDDLRVINRYDISGISDEEFETCKNTIFSEKTVDDVYEEKFKDDDEDKIFAYEYLPGQYDQRADSGAQCISIVTGHENPILKTAKVIVIKGNISDNDFIKIKKYCINPVDSREASLEKPDVLEDEKVEADNVKVLDGFIDYSEDKLRKFMDSEGLAMSFDDLLFCRNYFKNEEKRNPTITEIKVIDTYWSDHCRHTTFLTKINKIDIIDGKFSVPIKKAYDEYLKSREYVYKDKKKSVCLMDMATIAMKELKLRGKLQDLDMSDEINACSIVIDADIDGKNEKWLLMFKNETHNHPTEIEPFGGAATCIGGSIRDPLSGRAYVYQAMRVTGSADPRTRIEDTLKGRLPQRKITLGAAQGYSSYGNQIGLATGEVHEVYDEGFAAKRMEVGAVIAAVPKENVVREVPKEGDAVILLGGRTGRDGCGGATGSSKEHTISSIKTCGAEVQKGNAPTERKLQRLFRNPEVSHMIKRCNDFGAGGVSVAIGELSDGLDINLDLVTKKYEGLDGTELAISESQERMAVVVSKENAEKFIKEAEKENLEATEVAHVTKSERLKITWRGKVIVNIERKFLDTNGVEQNADSLIEAPCEESYFEKTKNEYKKSGSIKEAWINKLKDLNVCSERGLSERFDSTIGAGTVLMPFSGKNQLTPSEGMIAKLPVLKGDTKTGSIMTFGYNPKISKWSPFHGAVYAIVEAAAKVAALGGDYERIRMTFQEFFGKPFDKPERWGKPTSAMLGAIYAQKILELAAIGGKDSMSGTFMDMDVPPTLVAFAVDVIDVNDAVSQEFKKAGDIVIEVVLPRDKYEMPCFDILKENYKKINEIIKKGKVKASYTVKEGGVAEAVSKMCFGNGFSVDLKDMTGEEIFSPDYGSIILEMDEKEDLDKLFQNVKYKVIGKVKEGDSFMDEAEKAWEEPLEKIFKTKTEPIDKDMISSVFESKSKKSVSIKIAKPRVFIPVFPGTNCEYDSKRAFENAGAEVSISVFKNFRPDLINESIDEFADNINNSQIIMIPGGFSAGDEPDGSGKFIAAVFRNPKIKEAVMNLIKNRDGLMLGICNGFQALIKLGLVPYGEIRDIDEDSPTLTNNKIGRHMSRMVKTKVVSNLSPWFNNVNVGDVFTIPISHGEGRFAAKSEIIRNLMLKGQVATQYVDFNGNPSYDIKFNPNGSFCAVEGITSPDGRILGKMGHSERMGTNVSKNVPGNKDQKIFEAGVNYFR